MIEKEKTNLNKIFADNINYNGNKMTIQTQYGSVIFTLTDNYPLDVPDVNYDFFTKENREKVQTKINDKIAKMKGKYCVFPIIYYICQIIEDKISTENNDTVLDDYDELTDTIFYVWANEHKKRKNVSTVVTGREYYEKNVINK